jgi:hypothetical protein
VFNPVSSRTPEGCGDPVFVMLNLFQHRLERSRNEFGMTWFRMTHRYGLPRRGYAPRNDVGLVAYRLDKGGEVMIYSRLLKSGSQLSDRGHAASLRKQAGRCTFNYLIEER